MNKHETQKPHLSLFNSSAAFFIFQKIPGTRVSALKPPETTWNARRALLRPLYCLLVGDNISALLSALGTPFGAPGTARRALGTVSPLRGVRGVWNPLERAPAHLEPSGTREAHLEQSRRLYLERALAQMGPSDTA